MAKISIGRPSYIDPDDNLPRECISRGDIKSLMIRLILLFVFIIAATAACSLLQDWYLYIRLIGTLFVLFVLSLFIYGEHISEWLVYFWIFYIYKRIFGREGKKTSRLTFEERKEAAWHVTKQLFETSLGESAIEMNELEDPV